MLLSIKWELVKTCIHTSVQTYSPLILPLGLHRREVHSAKTQRARSVTQMGARARVISMRFPRFTPATWYLTKALSLPTPDMIQGSHQMSKNLLQGLSRLHHYSCIHYYFSPKPIVAVEGLWDKRLWPNSVIPPSVWSNQFSPGLSFF